MNTAIATTRETRVRELRNVALADLRHQQDAVLDDFDDLLRSAVRRHHAGIPLTTNVTTAILTITTAVLADAAAATSAELDRIDSGGAL